MRYYDLAEYIESNKIKNLQNLLLQGKKNATVKMLRDYYNGRQWDYNGWLTDTTRSGKQVWHINKKNPNDMGVGEGDLQVYNVCDSTINVYSSYARGTIHDNNRIVVDDNEQLSDLANEKLNLDVLIPRTITRAGVDSVCVWKFQEDGTVELLDTLEVFPIYNGEDRIGTVRIYEISKNDPIVVDNDIDIKKNEKAIYTEIWSPRGDTMWLSKYVNKVVIEDGKAPFDFDPHIYIANKDNEFVKFDENHVEVSDVFRLVDIQDALNKTVTEEGIIISKVAFPMIKVIKEIYDKMAEGVIDPEKLKKDLAEVSLVAGKIIAAPIERENGMDMPSGVDAYVDNILEQVYRVTGIPKGVYVSEGMSGISEKTMSAMMESLKRRVDEKRTNIERGVKEYIAMLTGNEELKDNTHVEWAEMFGMSKEEQANLIVQGFSSRILTREYSIEKILEILGDGEMLEELLASILEEDFGKKLDIEREKIKADTQKEVQARDKQLQKERESRLQAEMESSLLKNEISSL
jgi:hypothetical protein